MATASHALSDATNNNSNNHTTTQNGGRGSPVPSKIKHLAPLLDEKEALVATTDISALGKAKAATLLAQINPVVTTQKKSTSPPPVGANNSSSGPTKDSPGKDSSNPSKYNTGNTSNRRKELLE